MTEMLNTSERYRVVLHNVRGDSHGYSVVTWLGEKKAIALAVATHDRRHADADSIFDVEIRTWAQRVSARVGRSSWSEQTCPIATSGDV